ncbi:hypothetical protein DAI22_05g108301 [Oryza sativa Japonica Group]|nr:hypothetical protein DAI22_05g108301 [Oryza sativa Japonica Group]
MIRPFYPLLRCCAQNSRSPRNMQNSIPSPLKLRNTRSPNSLVSSFKSRANLLKVGCNKISWGLIILKVRRKSAGRRRGLGGGCLRGDGKQRRQAAARAAEHSGLLLRVASGKQQQDAMAA